MVTSYTVMVDIPRMHGSRHFSTFLETAVLVFKPGFKDKYKCFNCTNILNVTTRLFVPFCSVQDGKSTDVNGSIF